MLDQSSPIFQPGLVHFHSSILQFKPETPTQRHALWHKTTSTNIHPPSLPVQDTRQEWNSAAKPDDGTMSEKPRGDDERDADNGEGEAPWRPAVRPAEVTVTDVTLNSLTVTFRESRMAKGFFRDCGLKIWFSDDVWEVWGCGGVTRLRGQVCSESAFSLGPPPSSK